jgi:hypothetical protein
LGQAALGKPETVLFLGSPNFKFITTNHTNGHERLGVSMKARIDKMKRMEGRKNLRISSFSSVPSL